ncbi:hypothetical protein BOX15_Mlig025851g2 [Macrostomum lignano]|uniref:Integrin alpha-2 domain-containing protein n=1 Tax=Macrostomum lignano TaxID=282301 RepID=A0A267H2M7_9PLAT|nr:hypothetical protein BOX15_Mlig025851g2 [Macrostomum lignano]
MKSQLLLLLALLLVTRTHCRNGDSTIRFLVADSAFVLRGDNSAASGKSLLGYRVAVLKQSNDHYLLVSDPRAAAAGTSVTSGVVYRVKLTGDEFNTTKELRSVSAEISFDFASQDRDLHANRSVVQFGASISTLRNGQFAVCAPGYNFANSFNHSVTPGLCAYWRSVNSRPRWIQKVFKYEPNHVHDKMFGNCMGGFDAMLYDPVAPKLAISGPFCMKGGLASVSLTTNETTYEEFKMGDENDYSGFSLTCEPEKQNPDLYATVPHSASITFTLMWRTRPSKVDLQRIVMRSENPYYSHLRKAFNYMGYSSATIKSVNPVTRINTTAIILGAPFESNNSTVNFGCVYVVPVEADWTDSQRDSLALKSAPVRYCGSDPGGRLGISVVNIGDINHDGSEDFAVGCPGCGPNATGAVYLFLGQGSYRAEQTLEPFEILEATTDLFPGVSGLGWSLAVADDLDKNGENEIVATAINSGHVLLLPARILMKMSIEIKSHGTFIKDVKFSDLENRESMEVDMVISFRTGPGSDARKYKFDFEVKLQEFVEAQSLKRFDIEPVSPSTSRLDYWQQVARNVDPKQINLLEFPLKFRISFRSNSTRHLPANILMRDLAVLVRWRMNNRKVQGGPNHFSRLFCMKIKCFQIMTTN